MYRQKIPDQSHSIIFSKINVRNKQCIDSIASRQQDIYVERTDKKRKCKTPEDLREYQLWHMESQQELDQLKLEKKELKQQIRMGRSCLKENLKTVEYKIGESEELQYEEEDKIPDFVRVVKENFKYLGIVEADSFAQGPIDSEEIKASDAANVPEMKKTDVNNSGTGRRSL